jgi:putative SOS response-associated peptidase YedK
MCGRYAFFASLKEIENEFGVEIDAEKEWKERYNTAPSQKIPTILSEDGAKYDGLTPGLKI